MFEKSIASKVGLILLLSNFITVSALQAQTENKLVDNYADTIENFINNDNDSAILYIEKAKKTLNQSGTTLQKVKLMMKMKIQVTLLQN